MVLLFSGVGDSLISMPTTKDPQRYSVSFPRFLAALIIGFAMAMQPVFACTSLLLKSADGAPVYGRTMEFAFPLSSDAIVIPRQHAFTGTGPDGKPGLSWKAIYAATGLNAYGWPILVDGINERGLAGGILYFPNYAEYTDPAKADASKSMAPWEFLTWALTNFATVAEVKAAINDVNVISVIQPGQDFVPPVHYTLHDATGASLVIEPTGGKLVAYDNPFGVMTNAPRFDWHVQNLSNYIKMTKDDLQPVEVMGQEIKPFSTGTGMLGLPGDLTSTSRFVRCVAYASSVNPPKTAEETVRLTEHVMNNFDIPLGYQHDSAAADAPLERTQWTTFADLKNQRYYFKTIDYQPMREIDLKSVDLTTPGIRTYKLNSSYEAQSVEPK